jgi:mono/diheme cytochrome c family protein
MEYEFKAFTVAWSGDLRRPCALSRKPFNWSGLGRETESTMNFPIWELELGGGLLIAVVAVLHVYVSHFAIGGGLFLVLTEHYMHRTGNKHLKSYLVTHSKFFALVTLVFGAVTGVGIWFTIGLVSPDATASLIHLFVWGWAIEWVFFFVEIAAAIVYYSTWDRVSRGVHLAVGWVYFAAALLSLVVINGILAFMLTPGRWTQTQSFWDAFFNPTYLPSLVARLAFCVGLAGIYALVTGVFEKHATTRRRVVRYAGIWALVGTLAAAPALFWYHGLLPAGAAELLAGAMPKAALAGQILLWGGPALLLLLLVPIIFPKHFGTGSAFTCALLALALFGASEWIRESVRKPYVIYDYMYASGLRVTEADGLANRGGLLAHALWTENRRAEANVAAGKDVFRVACRACHTLDGYRGLRDRLLGLDEPFVLELIARLEHLRGRMPPFPGNTIERQALARYLVGEAGADWAFVDGEEVFDKRCGFCHSRDSYRALYEPLEGSTSEDIVELLPMLGEMTEAMPLWTGTEEEAGMLGEFIEAWYHAVPSGGGKDN